MDKMNTPTVYERLIFSATCNDQETRLNERLAQRIGESSSAVHERLRSIAQTSFVPITQPTEVITPSWYTYDASKILHDIPGAVVLCTSTCKHSPPYRFFVGRRGDMWPRPLHEKDGKKCYRLLPLGRQLSLEEIEAIYNAM
jgi:hypothetical protein